MIQLLEIIGKRLTLKIQRKNKIDLYPALLSLNTIPNELPYRLTWFDDATSPLGHVALNKKEYNLIAKGILPDDIDGKLLLYTHSKMSDLISIV